MGKTKEILRRDSRGCWPDFWQRVRLGLIVAAVIAALITMT